jgi:hypothetical protein
MSKPIQKTKPQKVEIIPTLSVGASKKIGAVNAPLNILLSELIDNPIPLNKPKTPIDVEILINHNGDESYIQILDNSIGVPEHSLGQIFNYATHGNQGLLLLSKMGMGMKLAISALGELEHFITKVKNKPAYKLTMAPYTNTNEPLKYFVEQYDGNEFPPYESGTLIKIRKCQNMIKKWKTEKAFRKFCYKIESTYPSLLNQFLNIKITYAKNDNGGNSYWEHVCTAYKPLMNNPRDLMPSGNGLGKNTPVLDRFEIQLDEYPEVKVKLTAWHKPTLKQVYDWYQKTKDETYNPTIYKESPWAYGSANSGIALSFKGKILDWNIDKKSSRSEDHGILLEIEGGVESTSLKSGVMDTIQWEAIREAVNDKLNEIGFYVRHLPGTPALAEQDYMDAFYEKLKNHPVYKKSFGIVDFDKQVHKWPICDVGSPDGVIYDFNDNTKVTFVIEGKKDRGSGEEARQLFGYMACYNCTNGIFVSPIQTPQFETQFKHFNKMFDKNFDVKHDRVIEQTYVDGKDFFTFN